MHGLFIALIAVGNLSAVAESSTRSGYADGAAVSSDASAGPRPAPRLMAAEKEERLRHMLPRVDDADLQQILGDPRLILYTEQEMPRAYQFWSGDLMGVHSPYYNLSANGSEPYGNGNREFPWGGPAGTHRTKGVEAFRFLWLPRDAEDRPLPVVWFRKRLRGDAVDGYAWTFPVGTVVGEVLSMTGPDGYAYTFELRVRTREYGYWDVDVFRPFPSSGDLVRRVKELRPDWQDQPNLVRFVEHLEQPLEMKPRMLKDNQPARHAFEQTMGIDSLPALEDDNLVPQLLTSATFHSTAGQHWRQSPGDVKTYAPTTAAAFHIV